MKLLLILGIPLLAFSQGYTSVSYGPTLPATCSPLVGNIFFLTSGAQIGIYQCSAVNTWTQAGGSLTVLLNGTTIGTANTLNVLPGTGVLETVTIVGNQINIQTHIDTTVTDTRLNAVSGGDLFVTDTGSNGTTYVGCPSTITPSLTTGMVVHLVPANSSTGGASTFNYCGVGAAGFYEANGLTNLSSTDLVAGYQQDIWYDGAKWRIKSFSLGSLAAQSIIYNFQYIPAANCTNSNAGNGWSSAISATCKAGTYNLGGYLSLTDAQVAQFVVPIPQDYVGGSTYPGIRLSLSSTDATSGHTIIPTIQVSCLKGDGSGIDDVAFNAVHALSTVTLNGTANRFWSTSIATFNSTDMTGCAAGSLMIVQIGRATDTATSANFYGATITMPRSNTAGVE